MSGVEIRVRSNSARARQDLNRLERSIVSIDTQAKRVTKTFSRLAVGLTAAFAGNAIVRGVNNASDSIANLENRLALVVGRGNELQATLKEIYGISARARLPVGTAADTFNRFGLALQGTSKSTGQILKVTEAVAQAATVSGATAQSAEAAIIQLGQGLASGELRGQELNSVLEQIPRLARAIADGMGVPFGQLRELAKDGKLTSEQVFQAIIKESENIDKEFSTLEATIGGLTSVLSDEFTRALSALDTELGFSESLKGNIISLTNILRSFSDNLYVFVAETKGQFRIFQNDVIFFAYGVKNAFKDIFNFNTKLDSKALESSFLEIKNSFDSNLGYLTEPIILKIKEIKLSDAFPTLETVKTTLSGFISFVENLFEYLYKAIVGDSWWGEIFWEGANRIGGPKLISALQGVRDTIEPWTWDIEIFFSDMFYNVTSQWDKLINYLNYKKIDTPNGEEVVLTRFGQLSELISKTGGKLIIDVSDKASEVFALQKEIETPGGIQTVDTLLGKIVGIIGNGLNFIEIKFSENFESLLEKLSENIQAAKTAGLSAAGPVTRRVAAIGQGAVDSIQTGKLAASGFIDSIIENQDKLGAAIFAGFLAASKLGFKNFALSITAVTFAPEILNSQSFQSSAKSLAKGFAEILKGVFTGEGDYGALLAEGIAETFSSIGEGIVEGIFGESFESDFANGFVGAATVAIGTILIVGKLRTAILALGIKLGAALWAGSWLSEFALGMGLALTDGINLTKNKKSWKAAAGNLGMQVGAAVQKGLIVGLTVGLVLAVSKALDDTLSIGLKEVFEKIGRTFTGESKQQQSFRRSQDLFTDATTKENGAELAALKIGEGVLDASDLSTLGIDKLNTLLQSVSEAEPSYSDSIAAFFNISTNAEKAAKIIEDAIEISRNTFGANPIAKASGGFISGPGTKTSDSIPAMLSKGEYVIRAAAVDKFGPGFFNSLNNGSMPRGFNEGGYVSPFDDEISALAKDAKALAEIGNKSALAATERTLDSLYAARRKYLAANYGNIDLDSETSNVPTTTPGSKDKPKDTSGQEFAKNFANNFRSGLTEALRTGDFKSFGDMLLDSFTMNIIDSFSQGFTDSLFKGLIGPSGSDGPLAGLFSGVESWGSGISKKTGETITGSLNKSINPEAGSGGSFFNNIGTIFGGFTKGIGELFTSAVQGLSGLFGGGSGAGLGSLVQTGLSFFGFMNQGGIVPSTPFSQAGKDSVPTMLTPGEMVVPANRVKDLGGSYNKSASQSIVNLSITGDVSRQTKQEIIKMLPTIANGVNAQNKEINYKR